MGMRDLIHAYAYKKEPLASEGEAMSRHRWSWRKWFRLTMLGLTQLGWLFLLTETLKVRRQPPGRQLLLPGIFSG